MHTIENYQGSLIALELRCCIFGAIVISPVRVLLSVCEIIVGVVNIALGCLSCLACSLCSSFSIREGCSELGNGLFHLFFSLLNIGFLGLSSWVWKKIDL